MLSAPKIKTSIGGQAVLEGVMMRGSKKWVVSVRRPAGDIAVLEQDLPQWSVKRPFLKLALVRGAVAMVEAMTLAIKAIGFSAQESTDEDVDISTRDMTISVILGLALAMGLFFAFPVWLTKFSTNSLGILRSRSLYGTIGYNLIEGGIRLFIFFLYLYAVSRLRDIRRVFEYHGAEHRTIHAFEHGLDLNVEEVSKFGTEHMRCGTSFLLIVMVTSMFIFIVLGRPSSILVRIASRLVILPLVAGVSYEIIKYAGRHDESRFIRIIMAPGLLLQRLTTRVPSADQMEVAIHSLKRLLELEKAEADSEPVGSTAPPP